MRYKVIISAQMDIEADSKEEAEQKAIHKYNKTIDNDYDKFSISYHDQLEFDAILDDIRDENDDEPENIDGMTDWRETQN